MNTTDKDIQVLQEMQKTCEGCIEIGCPICSAQRTALSHILSDFRDMRDAARYALATLRSFDEKYFFDDSDYHLLSETAINRLEAALDAWREVKGEK